MSGIWKQLLNIEESSPAAAATVSAAPNGEPQNPENSQAPETNCSTISADHDPPHHDQDACDAPPTAGQPSNPANSEASVNGGGSISAGGHASSQGTQETASVGNAQNPKSTDSVNDEVNASIQQNASTATVPQHEGDNSSRSPSSVPGQETDEEDGDTNTAEQTAQQEETDNCSHEQLLVSKVIRGQKTILDKLAANLDRTSHRVIKTWEHLACTEEINAPLEIRLKCKLNSENSCTVMLFETLSSDVEYEDTIVKDLMDALKEIGRNDVIKIITESEACRGGVNDQEKISDFVASNAKLIEEIATSLDQKSRVNKNWFNLGEQFKIPSKRLKEIEYGQSNPTLVLMEYLYSKNLTIGTLYDVVEKLNRNDVKKKLSPIISEKGRDTKMKEAIDLESDDMRDICVRLNNPNQPKRCIHVAYELGLPRDEYKDLEQEKPEGATSSLFTWIFSKRTDLNVGQLCKALEKIGRNDLVIAVEEHARQYQTKQQHSTTGQL